MDKKCECESSNTVITKKDLQIFRGTYEEVMNQPTVDMKFYLAWDTQQLFVGNKRGYKTPYNGRYKKEIDAYLADFKGEFIEDIKNSQDSAISDKVEEMKNSIVDDITNKLSAELTDIATSAAENVVGDMSDRITANTNKIASVNADLSGKIAENSNNISTTNQQITNIDSRISAAETKINENTDNISAVSNKVDNLHFESGILYKTGTEITELSKDIENFKPVFCTESYGLYKIGRIYYRDGDEIKAMASGGTIAKEKIDAGIRISASASTYIPMKDAEDLYTFTFSVSHPEALKSMSVDGKEVTVSSSVTKNINRRKAGSTTITVSAIPNEGTEEVEYTANSTSVIITVYQPWLFGNEGNLKQYIPSATSFSAEVKDGEVVYLYATKSNLKFKSSGFEVPTTVESNISHIIEGNVSANYYRYSTEPIKDTSFAMEIAQ